MRGLREKKAPFKASQGHLFFLGMSSHTPLFSAVARHTMHAIEGYYFELETIAALAMDDLLGGLIGGVVTGEQGATTPVSMPPEISAIVASQEEIADAAAALFLRLLHVVNLENRAPPEVAIKKERERAALIFAAINRFIGTAWLDPDASRSSGIFYCSAVICCNAMMAYRIR